MTKKPLTPDSILKRDPEFVRQLGARVKKAHAKAKRSRAKAIYTLDEVKQVCDVAQQLTARMRKKITLPVPRFFLGSDNDGHAYVVPVDCRKEWSEFLSICVDDEKAWSPPSWATPIDNPEGITFTDWAASDGVKV